MGGVNSCAQRHGHRLVSRDLFIRVRHASLPSELCRRWASRYDPIFIQGIRAFHGRYIHPYTTLAHTTSCPRITHQPILPPPPITHTYISLLAKVYYPAHRCRCTYTDSTICLHIGPTAPSLLKWVTMSFKLISIVFIPLAIMRTEYVSHHIHISFSSLQCAVSCNGFGCPLSACLTSFHPTRPLHVPSHVQHFALHCFFCLSRLHSSHSTFLFGLIPLLGHVLRSCFQSQVTFHNLEFPNTSPLVDVCLESESSNLNIIIDMIMI